MGSKGLSWSMQAAFRVSSNIFENVVELVHLNVGSESQSRAPSLRTNNFERLWHSPDSQCVLRSLRGKNLQMVMEIGLHSLRSSLLYVSHIYSIVLSHAVIAF